MTLPRTCRSDLSAMDAFLDKASALADTSSAFAQEYAGFRSDEVTVDVDESSSAPGEMVVFVAPAWRWVKTLRRHGGVWP